jgi:hypothetical protein
VSRYLSLSFLGILLKCVLQRQYADGNGRKCKSFPQIAQTIPTRWILEFILSVYGLPFGRLASQSLHNPARPPWTTKRHTKPQPRHLNGLSVSFTLATFSELSTIFSLLLQELWVFLLFSVFQPFTH